MEYKKTPYFRAGRADDLTGRDRKIYRLLEILPGALSWGTLLFTIIFSFILPRFTAYFIIAFDTYWLLKTIYLSIHLRYNWKRVRHNLSLDWQEMLSKLKYEHVWHAVMLPFYTEDLAVVEGGIKALLETKYDKKRFIIVLAGEEKGGEKDKQTIEYIKTKYANKFGHFIATIHPAGVPGEMAGKGSNIAYAAEEMRKLVLDPNHIPYEDVLVSAFDIDTVAYKDYFNCITWHFLTAENPHRTSYQPVPFYNNNIWHAPAFSRVAAGSSTFWQMMQQERPEKLATFSSHSLSFKSLYEIGYWQKNMVSEDSRIFWNLFLAHDGNYTVTPVSYPVSMDANLAPTTLQTSINIYKQHRRWSWGVENIPYMLMGFIKNKKIPLWTKIRMSIVQIEGFWSLATNPIMIFMLGWLPVIVGGPQFNQTVLSHSLPMFTRNIMLVAMTGLILSAMIFISFLPEKPKDVPNKSKFFMLIQWLLIPFTITLFSAVPGLDSQTRLMFGRYMGFWVTPKHRKGN